MFHGMEAVGIPLEMRCHLWNVPGAASAWRCPLHEVHWREFGSLDTQDLGNSCLLTAYKGENLRDGHHEEQHIPNPAAEEGWGAAGAKPGQSAQEKM